MRSFFVSIIAATVLGSATYAQTPAPIVVQAMTPAPNRPVAAVAVTTTSTQTALKALQALKAANDEILKQQAATLLKLDEIEKAANDIRIYSKRG
jgi:hypothetical protein